MRGSYGLDPANGGKGAPGLFVLVACIAALLLTMVSVGLTAPGDLDTAFGSGGKVTDQIFTFGGYSNSVAMQSDGKIVAAGSAGNGSNIDFALVRYNTDGSLDTSFGPGGIVITPVGSYDDRANSVAIQSNGRIVVAGSAYNGSVEDFALVRYNPDGSLDTSFGPDGSGIVISPVGMVSSCASSVAIQSDGKIVVAGSASNGLNGDFALVRYKTNGSLDDLFGPDGSGMVLTHVGTSNDWGLSVAIQSDGKIVAAGYADNVGNNVDFALVRYDTDGDLDRSFGSEGKVLTPVGSFSDQANAVAIQSDGKIVAAGSTYNGSDVDLALVRYDTYGHLDNAFGSGGIVITSVGSSWTHAQSVALQSDGSIVVAGGSAYDGKSYEFALVRYNTGGGLDSSFGTGGIVLTPLGGSSAQVQSLAVQRDGKIVAAGFTYDGSRLDFALARYLGTEDTPTSVALLSFTARAKPSGTVVRWSTASEIDNAGFHLWRGRKKNGRFVRITNGLIPAEGTAAGGALYYFQDDYVAPAKSTFYKLEDVDNSGTSTFPGPVRLK